MKKSENVTRLEILASPFMSEFSASFFEKILEDFYRENWEFSKEYDAIIQKKRDILTNAFNITILESRFYSDYLNYRFTDANSFEFYLREMGIDDSGLVNFFTQIHIFHTPFYLVSYLFAYIFAENIFQNEKKFEIFEKIISQGGSEDIVEIFQNANIDVCDENIYNQSILNIFP